MEAEIGTLIVRTVNATAWTIVVYRVLRNGIPVPALARKLIATVLFLGMWTLFIGGLTAFGFPGPLARLIYTGFAAYSGIAALGIATIWHPGEKERK